MKDELAAGELTDTLDALISLCNHTDMHYQERSLENFRDHRVYPLRSQSPLAQPTTQSPPVPPTEPMQLGYSRLSSAQSIPETHVPQESDY